MRFCLPKSILIVLFFLLVFPGCGKREEETTTGAVNHPPVVKEVKILPQGPSAGRFLYAEVKGGDLDGDTVHYRFQWEVNGEPVQGEEGSRLSPEYFSKGDRIMVWVTPTDGKSDGEPVASTIVVVRNSPPAVIQVELTPQPAFPGDLLTAKVKASDPDGEEVDFHYEWLVNGEVVEEGYEAEFSTDGLHRGDRISVQVTPEDSEERGEPVVSQEIVLQNRPPEILSQPPERLVAPGRYRYEVRAIDPDGDPLEFRLEGPVPKGMRIHKTRGILEWTFSRPPEGPVTVDIRVSDGQGGETQQRYDFTVSSTGKT